MFEETETDQLYQPQPGCCEDCDEALDVAAWEDELGEGVR